MSKLRIAVVGLGVGRSHLHALRSLEDRFELVAVCDPSDTRRGKACERYGVPGYVDLESLLEGETLDVVDLCTPPDLHFEQSRRVLRSGSHVICEKPLVPSLSELDVLTREENESGRRLMPIFQYRFGHGIQRLRQLVRAGVTGRAYLTTVETAWYRGSNYYEAPWRGRWQTEGGGVLLSHAIHAHDLMTYVLGSVRSVFARATTRVNPIETEDCAAASLELSDGSLATLSATLGSHDEISRLRFCFENVTAESSLAPYEPSNEPWTFTPANESTQKLIDEALADFDPGPAGYEGQLRRFADALEQGTELPVSLVDARTSIELASALYHSAETGERVDLPLPAGHPRYTGWVKGSEGPRLRRT